MDTIKVGKLSLHHIQASAKDVSTLVSMPRRDWFLMKEDIAYSDIILQQLGLVSH